MKTFPQTITIRNARTNNLKIDQLEIPLNAVTLVTGVSGSGKSSLVFDTIFTKSLLTYSQLLNKTTGLSISSAKVPQVEIVRNLPVAVALKQKIPLDLLRASVGEFSGISDVLINLFTTMGTIYCPECKEPVACWDPVKIANEITHRYARGTRFYITAPMHPVPHSRIIATIKQLLREGFLRFIVDGKIITADSLEELGWKKEYEFAVVVDRFVVEDDVFNRLVDSCTTALRLSELNKVVFISPDGEQISFSNKPICSHCGQLFPVLSPHMFNLDHPSGRCNNCNASGCDLCRGTGRNPLVLQVLLYDYSFPDLLSLPLNAVKTWMEKFDPVLKDGLLSPYLSWLNSAQEFHLEYLSLNRPLSTLSAGELQKLRLIEFWKNPPVGALSIFDEPLKFLDPDERVRFRERIKALIEMGQTVIIVDHHPEALEMADFVIELGPGAGAEGGKVIWSGTAKRYVAEKASLLQHQIGSSKKQTALRKSKKIALIGVTVHNLDNVSVSFPIGKLTYVTGPVASGKTSLVFEALVPALGFEFLKKPLKKKTYKELRSSEAIDAVVTVKEKTALISPTERSTVATFLNIFTPIRQFFAQLKEAKQRGLKPSHFSWNTPEGACSRCGGKGFVSAKSSTYSGFSVLCPSCDGRKYREDVLSVRYKGYSIADVLEMSLGEVFRLFNFIPGIQATLETVRSAKLSHIILGQPLTNLSGGELHRIWMIRQVIFKGSSGKHQVFCFDQPTAGLHVLDIENLVAFWKRLVASGNTVIVCDSHNLIENVSDWIIILGPGSGPYGGKVIYEGSPSEVGRQMVCDSV
jgi:excinuclease ABC subunit A